MMKSKKLTFLWFVQVGMVLVLMLVLNNCGGDETVCCREAGGINLDFSSLPGENLVMFTVDGVVGIRIYDEIKGDGTSLWCRGSEEVPTGSGNREDAAVMLLFSKLSYNVCAIRAEVHGHGYEAHIAAAQRDGTTQTAVCPGNKSVLTLHAAEDNPFIYAILSGQEAEWIKFRLE
jgi:hypothetical protein